MYRRKTFYLKTLWSKLTDEFHLERLLNFKLMSLQHNNYDAVRYHWSFSSPGFEPAATTLENYDTSSVDDLTKGIKMFRLKGSDLFKIL